jgi:hypothetical protein
MQVLWRDFFATLWRMLCAEKYFEFSDRSVVVMLWLRSSCTLCRTFARYFRYSEIVIA